MKIQKDKLKKILGYSALCFVSFVFFVYMTFPYGVLKETVASKLSQSIGMNIRIGDLSSALPLGLKMSKVEISSPASDSNPVAVEFIRVNISVLRLLIGKIGISAYIEDKSGGYFRWFSSQSVFSSQMMPSKIYFEASKFPLSSIVNIAKTTMMGNIPAALGVMYIELINTVNLSGELDGSIDLNLNWGTPSASSGKIDVNILKGRLSAFEMFPNVPEQVFTKAGIKGNLTNGALVFDNNSGLQSQALAVTLVGKIGIKDQLPQSTLDINVGTTLDPILSDSLWFLNAAQQGEEAVINTRISGTIGRPIVTR